MDKNQMKQHHTQRNQEEKCIKILQKTKRRNKNKETLKSFRSRRNHKCSMRRVRFVNATKVDTGSVCKSTMTQTTASSNSRFPSSCKQIKLSLILILIGWVLEWEESWRRWDWMSRLSLVSQLFNALWFQGSLLWKWKNWHLNPSENPRLN